MTADPTLPSAPAAATPSDGSVSHSVRGQIRGSTLLLMGRQITLLVNLVVQVLIVRHLSQTEYGAFAYGLTLVAPAAALIALGLEKGIARFVPIYHERGEHQKIQGLILLTVSCVVLLGAAAVLCAWGLWPALAGPGEAGTVKAWLVGILMVLAPLTALESVFDALFATLAGARAIFVRRHLLGPGLKLVAVTGLVAAGADVYALAVGYVGAVLLGVLVAAVLLVGVCRRAGVARGRLTGGVVPWRSVFAFSLPMVMSDLVTSTRVVILVWCLELFHSMGAVALFRAVLPTAGLSAVVASSFELLFTPLAARFYTRGDRRAIDELYWQTAAWITILSFPIFALTFALATPLAVLMFGRAYADAGDVMAVLAVGFYFSAAIGFNVLTLRTLGKVRLLVYADLGGAILILGLGLFVVPAYGALGAAAALTSVRVLQNVVYQIGLAGCGIRPLPARYLRLYLSIGLAVAGLGLGQRVLGPDVPTALALVGLACVGVLLANKNLLDVRRTFPEVLQVPMVRHVLSFVGV